MSVPCSMQFCESKEYKKCGGCYTSFCHLHCKLGFECLGCTKWKCPSCERDDLKHYCKTCKKK